jgi:hypothetical protein
MKKETNINRAIEVLKMYPTEREYADTHNGETEYYKSCKDLLKKDYIDSYYHNKEGYMAIMKILLFVAIVFCLAFVGLILMF